MTTTEKIQRAKQLKLAFSNLWESEDLVLFDYAVKALEQEPCDDAVSRQAVLKQLRSCLTGGETEYQYVKLHIDSIPSVRPQEPNSDIRLNRVKNELNQVKNELKPKKGGKE